MLHFDTSYLNHNIVAGQNFQMYVNSVGCETGEFLKTGEKKLYTNIAVYFTLMRSSESAGYESP